MAEPALHLAAPRIGGILFRHILREMALATAGVAAVLMVLLVTNQLAFMLGRVAAGQVPGPLLLEMVGLAVMQNCSVILPISLLLGVTLALGRLYHDSEMAAAQACGMSAHTPLLAAAVVTLPAVALAAWVAFQAGPEGARRSFEIRAEGLRTALVRGLVPGQFRSIDGSAVFYFKGFNADGSLHDVFFERRLPLQGAGSARPLEVMVATRARYQLAADGSLAAVVLEQGSRYEGVPGHGDWRRLQFREQTIPVPSPDETASAPRPDTQATSVLRSSDQPRFRGEYHWRIATVVITVLVGLLAVPLARLRPRQGRYGRVIHVVLFYAVYANLLIWGRAMFDKGAVPDWAGLWWVHALMLVLGLLYVRRR